VNSGAIGVIVSITIGCISALFPDYGIADDGDQLLTVDHYVSVRSTAPSMYGQIAQIYVRERLRADTALEAASRADRIVLFVHGGGTPQRWRSTSLIGTTVGWHTSPMQASTYSRWTSLVTVARRVRHQ
jgi:hypothetical protein